MSCNFSLELFSPKFLLKILALLYDDYRQSFIPNERCLIIWFNAFSLVVNGSGFYYILHCSEVATKTVQDWPVKMAGDWVAFILCFPSKDNRHFGVQITISISFNARDIYAQMYVQHGYNAAFRYNYKHFNYSTLRLNRTTIFLTASWFACKQWQNKIEIEIHHSVYPFLPLN